MSQEERVGPALSEPLSFDVEFGRLYPDVVRSVVLLIADRHAAEDVAQDAFVKALLHWGDFDSTEHVRRFLFRTAINMARSRNRHERLFKRIPFRDFEISPIRDPMTIVDDRVRIQRALLDLTWRQRTCVILADLIGLDAKAVAGIIHVQPSTVYVHLHRARQEMRRSLDQSGGE